MFGLYLAILKAYSSIDADPLSYDEKMKLNFYKEFDYFFRLHQNKNIIDEYAEFFQLKKIEKDAIIRLLKEEGFGFGDWCQPAELNIL